MLLRPAAGRRGPGPLGTTARTAVAADIATATLADLKAGGMPADDEFAAAKAKLPGQ